MAILNASYRTKEDAQRTLDIFLRSMIPGEEITLDVFPDEMALNSEPNKLLPREGDAISVPFTVDFRDARKEFERKYIERCLEQASGNVTKAAALLGMHRQSLQHKIKELGLTKRFIADE